MDEAIIEPPAWLLESIARSRADLAAGNLVSGEEVLAELFEAIEALEAEEASWRKTQPAA